MGEAASTHESSRRADWVVGAVLFVVGILAGFADVRTFAGSGRSPEFHHSQFAPAVLAACGRGFVQPLPGSIPALDAFVARRTSSFSCNDVPRELRTEPLSRIQLAWRYLLLSAAAVWRVAGVWSALDALGGLFYGAAVTLAFVLARTALGRAAAAFVALGVRVSPLHLTYLPQLRDYAKTPFRFALWAVLAWLLAPSRCSRSRTL
jgi:hypothetical protein